MKTKQIRRVAFTLHRYLGLAIGLIIVIIGLTGSLLVFHHEIDNFLVAKQFGSITPQSQSVSISSIVDTVQKAYSDRPQIKVESLRIPKKADQPYRFWVQFPNDKWTEVFVNPYTKAIMGERQYEQTLFGIIYRLHYELLAGKIGLVIAGIAALLLFILSLTGIALWPGWNKLIAGFKIKWNAHPKRVNFDVHKVTGIIVAVFLGAIALTGFCWNFYDQTEPLIYAATFTAKPPEAVSQPIAGKSALSIEELMLKADAALPGGKIVGLTFPQKPEAAFRVRKHFDSDLTIYGLSNVYLDQYTGKVVQIENSQKPSRAEAILNSFVPIHYGTFGGLPTRIFYVFVGLAPAILFVTGLVMWRYRRKGERKKSPLATL